MASTLLDLGSVSKEVNRRLKGGLVFLVLGVGAMAIGGYWAYPHVSDTTFSEPVEAEIVSANWDSVSTSEGGQRHYVNITYRYTVDGDQYTDDTAFPDERNEVTSSARAEEIATNYSAGQRVTAFVVPSDPDRAYLIEAAMPWWYYGVPGFGALISGMGLLNLVQGIRGVDPYGPDK